MGEGGDQTIASNHSAQAGYGILFSIMQPLLLQTPIPPNTQWWMIALAAVTILYVAVIRPAMKKKDPLTKPRSNASLGAQQAGNVERQMSNLLVELSEMARQLTAQLDTRSQKLEMLLQEADEKIAALQRASNSIGTPSSNEEPVMTPAEPPGLDDPTRTTRRPSRSATSGSLHPRR